MTSSTPSFPSLYDPRLELDSLRRGTMQPGGKYLESARDIYVFTLYWTFILYAPLYLVTALEPVRRIRTVLTSSVFSARTKPRVVYQPRKRSIAYGAVVFLVYGVVGTGLTVLGSTVIGFLIAGVYASGRFQVSTCVPWF
ncbi:hypothetical protein K439DRAFT_1617024 [Ramaria rubella]|nr:hypothetical protein K439DRAFT_1617024 [Ramaria rubella]